MSRSRITRVGLALTLFLLGSAAVAWATTTPTVLYKPPVIKALDHPDHNSEENMIIAISKDGQSYSFGNTPVPFQIDSGSDPGCDNDVVVNCPTKGVKKIIALLGAMNDSVDIGLGKKAEKVKQILKGQDGNDDLTGGKGTQKLVGGEGNDELEGGRGKDVLLGGPGIDFCDSGPGKDVVKDCEPVPQR